MQACKCMKMACCGGKWSKCGEICYHCMMGRLSLEVFVALGWARVVGNRCSGKNKRKGAVWEEIIMLTTNPVRNYFMEDRG